MKRTLKSLLLVAFSAVLLFVLTGCANVNYEIKLEKDGSGDVSYIMGYDKNFLNSMQVSVDDLKDDDSFDEMKQEATEEGYTVEEYEDDSTYGFKAYKHVKNVQNEFKIDEESAEDDGIKYEKTFLKTKYSQDAKVDLSDIMGNGEDALTKAVLGQMKISYKIVLPFKAGENNATVVSEDGKTLEWTLKAGQTNEIKFVAEQDDTVYTIVGIVVILALVVLGGMVVSYSKKDKNKSKKQAEPVVIKKAEIKKEEVKETKKAEPKKEEVKETKKAEPKKEGAKKTKKAEPKKEEVKKTKKAEPKKEEKKTDDTNK